MTQVFTFSGAGEGVWQVERIDAVIGETLPEAQRLHIAVNEPGPTAATWALRGFTSNIRYATGTEVASLRAIQEGLNRPKATLAALIPIKKSAAWWELAQDARRSIFEETSHHTAIGLEYLPPIARRLHHSRDLGEPFDFLTWFEFAPEHEGAFDELVRRLRETEEWRYVDREIDIRLSRAA